MIESPRGPVTYVLLLFLASVSLAAATVRGDRPTPPARAFPGARAGGAAPDLNGTWLGGWVDTVFIVPGPLTMDVTMDATDLDGTGTADLTGVGLLAAEPFTVTGSIVGDQITMSFSFDAAAGLVSTGDGVSSGTGVNNLTGTGSVGDPLFYGSYTFVGTVTDAAIAGTFEYGLGGAGFFALTKSSAVEPESWSRIKALHRGG